MAEDCTCSFPEASRIIHDLEQRWPLGANSDNMRVLLSALAAKIANQELQPVVFVQELFKAIHDFSYPHSMVRPDRTGTANAVLKSFTKLISILCGDNAEFLNQAANYFEEVKATWASYP